MRGLFWRRPVLVFDRLTNLADGIFGVAMTFLAFTIQLPAAGEGRDGGLAGKLTALLPQFLTLALSFFFSARCWVLHYRMHSVIVRGDECLLVLNLCFLFGIILVPFSADVLGNFPLSALSVTIYAANGTFIASMIVVDMGLCAGSSPHPSYRGRASTGTVLSDPRPQRHVRVCGASSWRSSARGWPSPAGPDCCCLGTS